MSESGQSMDDAVVGSPGSPRSLRKVVVASVVGTILEWFDFTVYAAVAIYISAEFFPAEDQLTSLLSTLAVLGVGFLARPFGAILFGRIGDRQGRKTALAWTMILMGASTAIIAVAPPYAAVGIVAPVVLVFGRILQGLSAGGEFGGGAVFLTEYAPPRRRGYYGAIFYTGTVIGPVLGAGLVALLTAVLTQEQMQAYGWRIPFLIGATAAVAGYFIRRKLDESPLFEAARSRGDVATSPIRESFAKSAGPMLRCVGLAMAFNIATHAYINMQSFIVATTDLTSSYVSPVFTLTYAIQVPLILLFGRLSDRIGRKPLLIAGALGMTASAYPLFVLVASGSKVSALLGLLIMSVVLALYAGPFTAAVTELMPTRTRNSSLSMAYAFSAAAFGGSAGYVVALLQDTTGSSYAPAIYCTAAGAITLLTALTSTETSARRP